MRDVELPLSASILRQLGIEVDHRRVDPQEEGIAAMMVDLYKNYQAPLTHRTLFEWHKHLMSGKRRMVDVGRYRTSPEPMQVISGSFDRPKVHFEAPPASQVPTEMDGFLIWFNEIELPAITKAGIAHHYFVSIHPFEDGNGRIARALAEKALAQYLNRPTLINLASTILPHRKDYYSALEQTNKSNNIALWLRWFAGIVIEAQRRALDRVEFVIDKTRLFDRIMFDMNERQEKLVQSLIRDNPESVKQGITAGKYEKLTGAHPETATRDLAGLTEKGALVKEGQRRHTRYFLNVPRRAVSKVSLDDEGNLLETPLRDSLWDRDLSYVLKSLAEGAEPATVKRLLMEWRWKDNSPAARAKADQLLEQAKGEQRRGPEPIRER